MSRPSLPASPGHPSLPASPGYPLAALRKLRDAAVDERIAALAEKTGIEEGCARALEAGVARRDAHGLETQRIEREEGARDGAGSAAALARMSDGRRGRRTEAHALAAAVLASEAALASARKETAAARDAVAHAKAEVEALARHRARWDAEVGQRAERRAEAEAEDHVQAALVRSGKA